jgi:hypothetical protein
VKYYFEMMSVDHTNHNRSGVSMHLLAHGILARGTPGSSRAILTFPQVAVLADGTLLATCRAGSSKDSDDEEIELYRSFDNGQSWQRPTRPFAAATVGGASGTLKLCYLTPLAPDRLLAAAMWVDRTSYPGQPLFNAATEGCLPMAIVLAESTDQGQSWSAWRQAPMPEEIGPPSLTNPVMRLADGSLAMSIETNKHYHEPSPWRQRVVFFHSHDEGQVWHGPVIVGYVPTGRIFNWDQRCAVTPDGRVGAFAWTYDTQTTRYLNIRRRMSSDHGRSWSPPQDLGFADQAAHPAVLPDGGVVLAWVDRFGTHSIRARMAPDMAAPFDPAGEVVLYTHGEAAEQGDDTGALLAEMGLWSFGLPYAEALPDGTALVMYYAGNAAQMDIRWARLGL